MAENKPVPAETIKGDPAKESKILNVEIVDLVAETLQVEILNREAFAKKVNEAIADFIIPRLLSKQMEIDGIIKVKNK